MTRELACALLDVAADATADEIKRAYRERAKATHPDLNRDDPQAAEKFRMVQEAYETLCAPASKAFSQDEMHEAVMRAIFERHLKRVMYETYTGAATSNGTRTWSWTPK